MLKELSPSPELKLHPTRHRAHPPVEAGTPPTSFAISLHQREDDDWLAARVGRMSPEPFETLALRWRPRLQAYCSRLLRSPDEAEDAVQEVMERAYRRLWRATDVPQFRPYAFTIAHNACLDRLRARPRLPQSALDENQADPRPLAPDRVESRDELDAVIRDVKTLSDRQRSALLLRELSGLSYETIAVQLDTTSARAKSLISEGRQVLAERRTGRQLDCVDFNQLMAQAKHPGRNHRLRAHADSCARCQLPAGSSLGILLPALLGWFGRRFRHATSAAAAGQAKLTAGLVAVGATAGLGAVIGHHHLIGQAPLRLTPPSGSAGRPGGNAGARRSGGAAAARRSGSAFPGSKLGPSRRGSGAQRHSGMQSPRAGGARPTGRPGQSGLAAARPATASSPVGRGATGTPSAAPASTGAGSSTAVGTVRIKVTHTARTAGRIVATSVGAQHGVAQTAGAAQHGVAQTAGASQGAAGAALGAFPSSVPPVAPPPAPGVPAAPPLGLRAR